MQVVIPIWFYDFGSMMYIFAAIIGALLSYFSFKIHSFSQKDHHRLLYTSFMFITGGFVLLAATNTYNLFNFEECAPNCSIATSIESNILNNIGNYGYYLTSIIGYVLFAMTYYKKKNKIGKMFPLMSGVTGLQILIPGQDIFVMYPFETSFFQAFHFISIALLAYIVYKTFSNYMSSRYPLSLLVSIGFAFILVYHVLMYALPFSAIFFAMAHFSLLLGFIALLVMLVRVRSSGRAKI
jgi:hypothetical protein